MLSLSLLLVEKKKQKTNNKMHWNVFTKEGGNTTLLYFTEEYLRAIIHLPLEHKNFAHFAHKLTHEHFFIRC